jgi:molybdenum cofactor cytidylyltransferase
MPDKCAYALVMLAAGGSRRMGRPKQLLPIDGTPMVLRAVEAAVGSMARPVIVVVGAHAEAIEPLLEGRAIHVVVNRSWADGMGSSVRAGVRELVARAPEARGVVIALADQPNLRAGHITRLLEVHQTSGKSMVTALRSGVMTPPVYFGAEHFPALLSLQGEGGARSLLRDHPEEVAVVPMEELADIDTPADLAEFAGA